METNWREEETVIDGIRCSLELWEEHGEERSSLFLFKETDDGSEYAASLHVAEAKGGLPHFKGGPPEGPELYPVSDATLDRVESWGIDNGY